MQESEKDLQSTASAGGEPISEGDASEIASEVVETPSPEQPSNETVDDSAETADGADTSVDQAETAASSVGEGIPARPLTQIARTAGVFVVPKSAIIIVAVLIPLVIAMSVGAGIWYANRKEDPWRVESGLVDYGGFSTETGSSDQIVIPGYGEILLDADTRDVMLVLPNPSGNPCYFRFSILLTETDEVIYTSGLVPPGKAIEELRLKRALEEGNYPAIIQIETFSLDGSYTPMNGANVETVLNLR